MSLPNPTRAYINPAPTNMQSSIKQLSRLPAPETFREVLSCAALLVFISAVWIEWDAYRYIGAILVILAIRKYFTKERAKEDKILIGSVGILCIAWGIYVAVRMLVSVLFYPDRGIGTSEGIYLFPIFYTLTGYALLTRIKRPDIAVYSFVVVCFLVILTSADFLAILGGNRSHAMFHKNTIHAAVAQGFILLCILPILAHLLHVAKIRPAVKIGFLLIGVAITFLSFACIHALRSKGVWLALAIALPLQFFLIVSGYGARRTLLLLATFVLALFVLGAAIAWDDIWAVAGDTFVGAISIGSDILHGRGVIETLDRAIQERSVPPNFRERLMLWVSALQIWSQEPTFGHGVAWLHKWQARAYQETNFNLLHNGYLEIAVRYGLIGLSFYSLLFSWTTYQVWRATREGLTVPAAFHAYLGVLVFFCLTILSNSNIRLALGESYMWFAAAFGFYCFYQRQRAGFSMPRSWI